MGENVFLYDFSNACEREQLALHKLCSKLFVRGCKGESARDEIGQENGLHPGYLVDCMHKTGLRNRQLSEFICFSDFRHSHPK